MILRNKRFLRKNDFVAHLDYILFNVFSFTLKSQNKTTDRDYKVKHHSFLQEKDNCDLKMIVVS